jgi:hypothetical protein
MLQIYIPNPVVVENTLVFQAQLPHNEQLITITKPSNGALSLHYNDTVIPHDKYYHDTDNDIHHAVYTLPNQQQICVIWIPRPMTYHHIHIQTPRMLVQISTPNTHE